MIEGLKCIVKGSELKEVINTKIGWNADKMLEISQRRIQVPDGGDMAEAEKRYKRDIKQLQFLHDHIRDDEEYSLNIEEVSALGVGLESPGEKSPIIKLN